MSDLDFSGALALGQHIETDSVVHRLHPGTKLFGALVLMTGLVASSSIALLTAGLVVLFLLPAALRY